jgi:hypothetical protein
MSDFTLNLGSPIPALFRTPKERHEYGSLMAKNLELQLKVMGIQVQVLFDIVTPEGTSEGPDDQEHSPANSR